VISIENDEKEYLVIEIEKFNEVKLSKIEEFYLIVSIIATGVAGLTVVLNILNNESISTFTVAVGIGSILHVVEILRKKSGLNISKKSENENTVGCEETKGIVK